MNNINCFSHSDITTIVESILCYLNCDNFTLDDEPITGDAIDGYIENMLDDDEQWIYIYIEQDSDLIDIISGTIWGKHPAEDEWDYDYHRIDINYNDGQTSKPITLIFAIN